MSLRARLALYVLFLSAFLISAPLVVLYTAGYRINFDTGKLTKTGILSLSTSPRGATIFLDGKRLSDRTPAVLKNILPGEHAVRFEKEGFTSWEKRLDVDASGTTFATGVALFFNREPEFGVVANMQTEAVHANSGKIAYVARQGDWDEVWTYVNNAETLIARYPSTSADRLSLLWSRDGNYLSIESGSGVTRSWSLVDTTSTETISLTELMPEMEGGWWDASADARFYARDARGIVRVDLPLGTMERIESKADAVQSAGANYLVAKRSNDRTTVAWIEDAVSFLLAYIPAGNYRFEPAPSGIVMLFDALRGHIVLLDERRLREPILLQADANIWQWEPDGRRLLYSDGFDLHIFDADSNTDETVTRVSDPITGLSWYAPAASVLYAQDTGLYAIELDYRDGRNVITLASGTNIRSIFSDARGRNAYFFGILGGTDGLWMRQLQR